MVIIFYFMRESGLTLIDIKCHTVSDTPINKIIQVSLKKGCIRFRNDVFIHFRVISKK